MRIKRYLDVFDIYFKINYKIFKKKIFKIHSRTC